MTNDLFLESENILRLRSSVGRIRIRICDLRSLGSWCTKGTGLLAYWISYHDSRREIAERVSAECTGGKFEKENKVAAACSAAVVSLMEELADDPVLQEASSSEDDEFLFFLLIDSKERKSHVRIACTNVQGRYMAISW